MKVYFIEIFNLKILNNAMNSFFTLHRDNNNDKLRVTLVDEINFQNLFRPT